MQEKDYNPIEMRRHRDTDGDGAADYIDSNGYSKPNDKYRYRDISSDDYRRLKSGGFDVEHNCCPILKRYIWAYPYHKSLQWQPVLCSRSVS